MSIEFHFDSAHGSLYLYFNRSLCGSLLTHSQTALIALRKHTSVPVMSPKHRLTFNVRREASLWLSQWYKQGRSSCARVALVPAPTHETRRLTEGGTAPMLEMDSQNVWTGSSLPLEFLIVTIPVKCTFVITLHQLNMSYVVLYKYQLMISLSETFSTLYSNVPLLCFTASSVFLVLVNIS